MCLHAIDEYRDLLKNLKRRTGVQHELLQRFRKLREESEGGLMEIVVGVQYFAKICHQTIEPWI